MDNNQYTFFIIPDLAEKPISYLIYQGDDRSKPIAILVFEEDSSYEVFNMTDNAFTCLEELNISLACEKLREHKFFPSFDV